MIVDIGGGTSDIAVISLGGTVVSASIKVRMFRGHGVNARSGGDQLLKSSQKASAPCEHDAPVRDIRRQLHIPLTRE